eukprot:GHVU01151438.1.p1 GENE.GHVU01151438.1~~GHVU01151438.1.p1  ORF type:complete len:189 (+),score=26.85 GHVU01151438.1:634-1200(+)
MIFFTFAGEREDLYVCTLLDPNCKGFNRWPTRKPEFDLKWGLSMLRGSWNDNFRPSPLPHVAMTPSTASPTVLNNRTTALSRIRDFIGVEENVETQVNEPDELDEYLQEKTGEEDVMRYWWKNRKRWPNLTRMFRQYLAAPASTAGIERVFSKAGRNHSDFQKRVTEGTLEKMLIAGINSKVADFFNV